MGETEGRRRSGWWKLRWLDMPESQDSTTMRLSKVLETFWVGKCRETWSAAVQGITKSWVWLSNKKQQLCIQYVNQEEIFQLEIQNSLYPQRKIRCYFLKYGHLSISFMNVWMPVLLLKLWEFKYFTVSTVYM